MKRRNFCPTESVATSEHCEVACCHECGQVVLSLPHITLRLPVALFMDAAACIEEAAARLPLLMDSGEESDVADSPAKARNASH